MTERDAALLGVQIYQDPDALRGDVLTALEHLRDRRWCAFGVDAGGAYTIWRAPYQLKASQRAGRCRILALAWIGERAGPIEDFVCDAALVLHKVGAELGRRGLR